MTDKFVSIVPGELEPSEAYRLMLSVVVPRPIAWVSTLGADGTPNLAPFSFFTGVTGTPPTVMFSVGRSRRDSGPLKDTLRNAQETGEFVVNLVDEALAEAMNLTAGDWPPGTNEFEVASLEAAPSVDVKPPRVAASPLALEARVTQLIPVEGTASTLILGRVLRYHIRQDLLRPDSMVDAALMRPIARLGGGEYATFGEVFSLTRPTIDKAKI